MYVPHRQIHKADYISKVYHYTKKKKKKKSQASQWSFMKLWHHKLFCKPQRTGTDVVWTYNHFLLASLGMHDSFIRYKYH